ncbi:MazF family transcriptional regulator [Candidatus Tenderia electrophaga]|uniref:mRNA interferase n=1 Tax=Candidatus Tenderia electrophaga TaxID=1748243 RepID=A0A0S2TFF6_9GAMM|nr:MazF family transcriptional regulator [Candidatus Tenderia electrophaga]
MVEVIRRGEVWVANLNPNRKREIGKVRPVLVMQADELTAIDTPTILILPMSTQVYPTFKRWRITIPARDRLLKECQILIDQPRALDRVCFGEGPLTRLRAEEMAAVEKSFLAVIGM